MNLLENSTFKNILSLTDHIRSLNKYPDMELTVILVIVATMLVVTYLLVTVRPYMVPPGPRLVPLLGNLHLLLKEDARALAPRLRNIYGDIYSLYFGKRLVIVVNGLYAIKETFIKQGDFFSDRPSGLGYDRFTKGRGIMNTSGSPWKQQRRFTIMTLRDLGMGNDIMEAKIGPEMIRLVSSLIDLNGTPFDPHDLLLNSAANVIFDVMLGKRFESNDPELAMFSKGMTEVFTNLGMMSFLHFIPLLGLVPGDPFKFNKLSKNDANYRAFMSRHIKERLDVLGDDVTCFTDAYIHRIRQEVEGGKESSFNVENLTQILLELFFAGSETTAVTLQWMMLFLATNMEIQDEVHEEIDSVLCGSFPAYRDRENLPHLESVILETQRLGDVVPFGMMHGSNSDTILNGFNIPKDTILVPCMTSVLMDSNLFPNPKEFQPERFLGKNKERLRDAGFIPFFLGKRICLGESLARMELFLLSAAMLQHFRFVLPEDNPPPSFKGILGATRRPDPFKIKAVRRDP